MSTQTMLVSNIDALFTAARPRLLRQAHMRGVAPDAVDDVVQETLLEAWRHLDALRLSFGRPLICGLSRNADNHA